MINGRVFGRSWSLKPDGWYHAFREDPRGAIRIGTRTIRVRAVHVRSEAIRDAIERAYAKKYPTPASRKYVRGFTTKRRRDATMEFVNASWRSRATPAKRVLHRKRSAPHRQS